MSAFIAPVGQLLPQMLQRMQFPGSNSRCPLLLPGYSRGAAGYLSVAGLLKRFLSNLPPIFITAKGSPLRAADAWVDGEDLHRHVLQAAALQGPHHDGDVYVRRCPHPRADEVLRPVTPHVVERLAAGLFQAVDVLPGGRVALDGEAPFPLREVPKAALRHV